MKIIRVVLAAVFISALGTCFLASAADAAKQSSDKIKVLIVTGGHPFEKEPFFKLFKDNPDITYQAVVHPNFHALLKAEAAKQWDVLVLYDLYQNISEEAKADFLARLKDGKGLVVLHHAIADYQAWPEYSKIIGARYYLAKTVVNGVDKPRSLFKEGMEFKVTVADPQHPVTCGIKDYAMHDEVYKLFDVSDECHPLLTTDEPLSNHVISWTKTYEAARVFYIQSGHDHHAYENPNYQRLVRQAIRWTAKRD